MDAAVARPLNELLYYHVYYLISIEGTSPTGSVLVRPILTYHWTGPHLAVPSDGGTKSRTLEGVTDEMDRR
jgi:hypothetical protein